MVDGVPSERALSGLEWDGAVRAALAEQLEQAFPSDPDRSVPDRAGGGGADRLDAMTRYALLPPGKLLRPWLLLTTVSALGGDAPAAVPAAVALEMLHAATLVHDDILDEDPVRRGRPSVVRRFGEADALVAGDAMICAALGHLSTLPDGGVPAERAVAALRIAGEAGVRVCRGQVLESAMAGRPDCPLAEYVRMVRLKTGGLLGAATRVAAALTCAAPETAEALAEFGDTLGVAFQMADDLLPYAADPAAAGKPPASDLRNRRPTLPVLLAHRDGTPAQRAALASLWSAPSGDAEPPAALLAATGALATARAVTADHAARARARLTRLPPSPYRDRLAAVTDQVAARAR